MDIRQQWFGLLISSQVIFPGKVSADWNSQAIFPIYVEEEDKELFGLATNFNSFSGSTKVTQLVALPVWHKEILKLSSRNNLVSSTA